MIITFSFSEMDITAAFATYGSCVEKETEVRENVQAAVKDLEKTSYSISTLLEKMHNAQGIQVIVFAFLTVRFMWNNDI